MSSPGDNCSACPKVGGEERAEILFRAHGPHFEATVEDAIDQRPDERGTIENVPAPVPDIVCQAVQPDDLPVEKDDRYFRPVLVEDDRAPATRLRPSGPRFLAPHDHLSNHTKDFWQNQHSRARNLGLP
jgi:hypothetical protein